MQIKFKHELLKKAFERSGMSFTEFAAKSGYSETWVRKVLSGERATISKRVAQAFANTLKMSVDSVLVK